MTWSINRLTDAQGREGSWRVHQHSFPSHATNNDLRIQYGDAHAKHFYIGVSGVEWVEVEKNAAPAVALQILKAAGWNREQIASATGWGRLAQAIQQLEGFEKWRLDEGKWVERKDELANMLINPHSSPTHPTNWTYANTTENMRRAIDMIVELEKKAEAAK